MKEITSIVSFCPRLRGNVPSLITVRAADRCFRVCFCILRVYVTLYLELLCCADTRQWRKERPCRLSLLLLGCSFGVMAPSLWKGLVGICLFALAHVAFSAAQHPSYMRLTEKEDESLPVDIYSSSDTSGLCSYLLWYSSYCRGV